MRFQVIVMIEDEDDKVFFFETDNPILDAHVEEAEPE